MKIRREIDLELEGRLLIVPEQIELVMGASWSECDWMKSLEFEREFALFIQHFTPPSSTVLLDDLYQLYYQHTHYKNILEADSSYLRSSLSTPEFH